MKRIINTAIVGLLCIALVCPSADARGRNNNQQSTSQSSKAPARPNNGNSNTPSRPNNGNQGRPGGTNNQGRPNNGNQGRPGDANNQGRPNNGNQGRPGGNTPSNNRPSNVNPPHNNNHGNHGKPGPGAQPPKPGDNHGYKPGGNYRPPQGGVPNFAPNRPMMPPPRPFARPVPPPSFRPRPNFGPNFGTILGIALGTAINISIDHLLHNGYYVAGYTNDAVYLNDVIMLNMLWPTSTLYYNRGRLTASEFTYWTLGANASRYYQTYNMLTANYGYPISTHSYPSGGMQSSWFGADGRFVTLQYMPERSVDGQWRYYTTLSFGN